MINGLYRNFPDPSGIFRRRLRSTVIADHLGALDELFVYDRISDSYRVVYEEGGEGPDFRLYNATNKYMGAIEVASLFMRNDWAEEEQRFGRITDELNQRVPLTSHFVHLEITRWNRDPRVARLAEWLRRTIEELQSGRREERDTEPGPPERTYSNDAVELVFNFLPVRPGTAPAPTDRLVGMGSTVGGFVNSSMRLRERLDAKAGGRYDLRDESFAIAVGIHDSFCSLDQIEDALFGGEQVAISTGVVSRRGDGFYGLGPATPGSGGREGKNRRVSCVFAVENWRPGFDVATQILRLDNPFCLAEFATDILAVDFHWKVTEKDEHRILADWRPYRP